MIGKKDVGPMPTVTFVKEKKSIEVPAGANLRVEALKAGIEIYPGINKTFNCMGLGTCGSCRVMVKKGVENANSQGVFEKLRLIADPITFFSRLGNETTLRLSCKLRVNGDMDVETQPSVNWHGENFWS